MRSRTGSSNKAVLSVIYFFATIQFVWCYLWLTRPYVSTALYEQGRERMPFQGRMLMMFPMRWAHHSYLLSWIAEPFARSHFWFPKPVAPEVLVQAVIGVACLLIAGWMTTSIYKASSRHCLLAPMVYPLLLVVCMTTYVMHTVQNFRFIYDLPSLALFSIAMYLMYFQRHWLWFMALFLLATVNRETTLLLLPLYAINGALQNGRLQWKKTVQPSTLALIVPLAVFWTAWQFFVHHHFAHNMSELYPRINWNVKSLAAPLAWPQLLSAGGYLLLFVIVMRDKIADARLRAWLWLIPVWLVFMFVYGILIETRIFGELIPLIVCTTTLIVEDILVVRMRASLRQPALVVVEPAIELEEAA